MKKTVAAKGGSSPQTRPKQDQKDRGERGGQSGSGDAREQQEQEEFDRGGQRHGQHSR